MFKPPRSEEGEGQGNSVPLWGLGQSPIVLPDCEATLSFVRQRSVAGTASVTDRTAPVRRNKYALFYYIGTKRQPCKAVLICLHLLTKVWSILFPNFILTAPPPLHIIKTNFRYCFYDVRCAPHFVRRFLSDIVKTKTNICFYSPLGDEKEVFRGLYQL